MSWLSQQDSRTFQFGSIGNLSEDQNSEVVVNVDKFNSIGFRLVIPIGATVVFEGSFDGVNYSPITLREIGSDGYTQSTDHDEDYIGSVSVLRKFRARVSVAGIIPGDLIGNVSQEVSTLEGQEHDPPPHEIGHGAVHRDFEFDTAQSATDVWTPAAGRKFVVTDFVLTATGEGDITLFDETDSAGNRLYKGTIGTVQDLSTIIPVSLKMPFVSSAVDNDLKLTTTGTIQVDGVVHGYEVK